MQAQKEDAKGIYKSFTGMVKTDGWKSFYKGLKMAIIATVFSSGSYFFLYNLLKKIILSFTKTLTKRHIALMTAIAGALSSVITNPFWFLNTRLTLAKKEKQQ
jgi:hypothetical protein